MTNFRRSHHDRGQKVEDRQSDVKKFDEFELYRNAVKPLHIPEFRGGTAPSEISVEMFVEIVDTLRSTYRWSNMETAEKVSEKLQGEAARWRWTTYDDVKLELKKTRNLLLP